MMECELAGKPAQAFAGQIDRLPTLPAVAIEVLDLTRDPGVSIDQLIAVVSRDPALSARLVRLANSSVFRRGDPVSTLREASLRLGIKTVKVMALSFTLAQAIPRRDDSRFDHASFWRHSIVTTVAARTLARLVRCPYEDEAFLCGLLGRIGELVLAEGSDASTPGGQLVASDGEETRLTSEMSSDDALYSLGSQILRHWDLPEIIWRPVRFQRCPEQAPPDCPPSVVAIAQILRVADATATFISGGGEGRAVAHVAELTARYFGFSAPQTESFVIGLEGGIFETALLLNTGTPCAEGHDALLERARQQLVAVSLDAAVDLQTVSQRAEALEQHNRELVDRLHIDVLTGLPDRARFESFLAAQVQQSAARRRSEPLSVLMIDVDDFKEVNDTYGHLAGDQLLRSVADALRAAIRSGSFVGRIGGDEFVAVLPGVGIDHLEGIAERIRLRVAERSVEIDGMRLTATVSIGATCSRRTRDPKQGRELVARADALLYEAKHGGRNCSVARAIDED